MQSAQSISVLIIFLVNKKEFTQKFNAKLK